MGGGQKGGESDAMFTTDNWHFPPPLLLFLHLVRSKTHPNGKRSREGEESMWVARRNPKSGWVDRRRGIDGPPLRYCVAGWPGAEYMREILRGK